ncbi:hypothetical protein EfmAA94_16010 [Enterococcus faecium]|nr:hypothetical protein EfmAA94_16010 [Enterococcus faecium]
MKNRLLSSFFRRILPLYCLNKSSSCSHLEKAINSLLRTELTAFLDYEKYDRTGFNSGNSRNGSYFRSIKTEYGELTLEIPRDRNGEFKQQTLPAYKRTNDTLE